MIGVLLDAYRPTSSTGADFVYDVVDRDNGRPCGMLTLDEAKP